MGSSSSRSSSGERRLKRSSSSTAIGRIYTDSAYYTGGQTGTVCIYVREVKGALGAAHHYIRIKVPGSDKLVVYEWSEIGSEKYAADGVIGKECLRLGEFSLDRVNDAANRAARGKSYDLFDFNCNHFAEAAAEELGKPVVVSVDCGHWSDSEFVRDVSTRCRHRSDDDSCSLM